jgi:hypothetical protein
MMFDKDNYALLREKSRELGKKFDGVGPVTPRSIYTIADLHHPHINVAIGTDEAFDLLHRFYGGDTHAPMMNVFLTTHEDLNYLRKQLGSGWCWVHSYTKTPGTWVYTPENIVELDFTDGIFTATWTKCRMGWHHKIVIENLR